MVPRSALVSSRRLVMSALTCCPNAAGWSVFGNLLMNSWIAQRKGFVIQEDEDDGERGGGG